MTEILLSYDGSDRERVRPARDALTAQGFDVLWEQEAPDDTEWEGWVRKQLAQCRCVVAFHSAASMHSNRMRLVATMAEEQGKLVLVRLERGPWRAGADGLELAGWTGDAGHPHWKELLGRIEAKLKASLWVQRLLHDAETKAADWQAQYESSLGRSKSVNDELARERSDRGAAEDKAAGLQAQLDERAKTRSRLEARAVELEQRLAGAEEKHAEAQRLLKEELRQRAAQLTQAQGALTAIQDEAARLKTEVEAAENAGWGLKSRNMDLETALREREARIVRLAAEITARNGRINELQASIAELTRQAEAPPPPPPASAPSGLLSRVIMTLLGLVAATLAVVKVRQS